MKKNKNVFITGTVKKDKTVYSNPPKFDEFYKPPYKNDWGIVFSSNGNWAWTFKNTLKGNQERLMNMIQEDSEPLLNKDLLFHEGGEIFQKSENGMQRHMIMQIRGWGALTGTGGGLGLDPEVACKIQDDFCDWLISKISK